MQKTPEQLKIEQERRSKLKNEKPYVYEKIMKYKEKNARGEITPVIEFIYDHICNMKCSHCSNLSYAEKERSFTVADVAKLSRQADELGLAQFAISGGEPLMYKELEKIVKAIDPNKFHITISTNGLLLSEEKAKYLKKIGVDKVKISVDSIDKEVYAKTRMQNDSYDQTFKALFNAKNAGLQTVVQTVISHQTCRSKETEQLAQFCQENNFNLDVMIARAVGAWEGKKEVLIDSEDAKYLRELNKKYSVVHRDVFPTYEEKQGSCGAMRKVIFFTKYGDAIPCAFMHIKVGNIFEQSLKEIIDCGMNIKYFANPCPVCLSGENKHFIKNYIEKTYGKQLPVDYREIFNEQDFISNI